MMKDLGRIIHQTGGVPRTVKSEEDLRVVPQDHTSMCGPVWDQNGMLSLVRQNLRMTGPKDLTKDRVSQEDRHPMGVPKGNQVELVHRGGTYKRVDPRLGGWDH